MLLFVHCVHWKQLIVVIWWIHWLLQRGNHDGHLKRWTKVVGRCPSRSRSTFKNLDYFKRARIAWRFSGDATRNASISSRSSSLSPLAFSPVGSFFFSRIIRFAHQVCRSGMQRSSPGWYYLRHWFTVQSPQVGNVRGVFSSQCAEMWFGHAILLT